MPFAFPHQDAHQPTLTGQYTVNRSIKLILITFQKLMNEY
jgi:hypothetical protein